MELTNTYDEVEKNNFLMEGYKAIAVGEESLGKLDQGKKKVVPPVVETISEEHPNDSLQISAESISDMEPSTVAVEIPNQTQSDLTGASIDSIEPITNSPLGEEPSPINMEPEEPATAMDIPVFDAITPIITEPNEEISSSFVDDSGKKVSLEMQEAQSNPYDMTGTVEPTIGEPVALEPVEVNEAIFDMPEEETQQDSQDPLTKESVQESDSQSISDRLTSEMPKEEQHAASQLPQEVNSQPQLTDTPKIQAVTIVNPNGTVDLEGELNRMLESTVNLQRQIEQVSEILRNDRLQREEALASAQKELASVVAQPTQTMDNQNMTL